MSSYLMYTRMMLKNNIYNNTDEVRV